jgi:hypothetical protein
MTNGEAEALLEFKSSNELLEGTSKTNNEYTPNVEYQNTDVNPLDCLWDIPAGIPCLGSGYLMIGQAGQKWVAIRLRTATASVPRYEKAA